MRPFSSCLGGCPRADSEELGILFLIPLVLDVGFSSLPLWCWSRTEVKGCLCSVGGTEKSRVQKVGGLRFLTPFGPFTKRNRGKPSSCGHSSSHLTGLCA